VKLTVELEPGPRPFKLLDGERHWDGDHWAWKFLRLNPRYRHDVVLAARSEKFGEAWRLPSVDHFLRTPAGTQTDLATLLGEDSRLFVADKILESESRWPVYVEETLGAHLQRAGSRLPLSSVRFREFDAPRDYGIADWLDPKKPELPQRAGQRSWFHWLTDPIWDCGHEAFAPFDHTVGFDHRGRKFADGVRVRPLNERLIGTTTAPVSHGRTWLAFAVNLSLYLPSQLRGAREVADLYRDTLSVQPGFQSFTDAPFGFELLIWSWNRHVRQLPRIDPAVEDLLRSQPDRQPWFVAMIDVRFDLSRQFFELQKQLKAQQQNLRERGRKSILDFWLKRRLVLAELQVLNADGLRSTGEIERALFDAGSTEWQTFWRAQTGELPDVANRGVSQFDAIKRGLPEARAMVEREYGFLVGQSPADLHG
jgi:hypothetical protein